MTGPALRVVVMTVSDRSAAGEREDRSGPVLAEAIEAWGAEVVGRDVVPDDRHGLTTLLQTLCDDDSRGSLDQCEVREGLREVPEVPAGFGGELLRIQPER